MLFGVPATVTVVLGTLCALLAVGLALCVRLRLRARRTLGAVIHRQPAGRGERLRGATVLVAAASVALATLHGEAVGLALVALALALGIVWFVPREAEGACGSEGVWRGWVAVPLAALEEWRLVGDHLRFRVAEAWHALELPREKQAGLRAALEERAGERESPFR